MARLGAMWTLLLTFGNQFISVITTTMLARVLLPSDYGIMGMVATLTALLAAVSSMGLSWATIQRKNLTMTQVHNLFWINAAAGLLLWVISFATAPFLAAFYGEGAVTDVTRILGITFVISGLAVQPLALLQRQLRFRISTIIEIIAQVCGAVVAVVLALRGWGYWALVSNGLASQAVRMVLAFATSGYRPGPPRKDATTISMLTFGGYLTLSSVVTYMSRNTDNILIGRVWGSEALGYYSRAYFLMTLPTMLFTTSLSRVMIPSLSALAHDRERMGAAYRKAVRAIAFVGYPVAVGLAVAASEAVRLVYGEHWAPVAPILAWLSIAMVSQVIASTNGWLYTAVGKSRLLFLVGTAATGATIVAIWIGNIWGPIGVAASYTLLVILITIPLMLVAHRISGLPLKPTLGELGPLLAIAAVMGGASLAAGWVAGSLWHSWFLTLIAKMVVGGSVFVGLCLFFVIPWPLPILERARIRVEALFRTIGSRIKLSPR